MKEKFRDIHLSKANMERLMQINEIIDEYKEQGYKLTLRQLYYQLVSRDIIPNKATEYAKISTILKEGRMGGFVDWAVIEDRVRVPYRPYFADDVADAINDIVSQYRLDRMKGQPTYIEVWVEKDALSGVLKRVTSKYGVNIVVNRGYSSVSAMYDAFYRFKNAIENNQKIVILYLGDYDPSGIDMIRDIRDRISEFFIGDTEITEKFDEECTKYEDGQIYHTEYGKSLKRQVQADIMNDYFNNALSYNPVLVEWVKDKFNILPIALSKKQIEFYNPPPNPAKTTDPRSGKFILEHGNSSWEVDALRPEILNDILENAIEDYLDQETFQNIKTQEKIDKNTLLNIQKDLASK